MKEAYEHTAASFFAKMLKLHLGVESALQKTFQVGKYQNGAGEALKICRKICLPNFFKRLALRKGRMVAQISTQRIAAGGLDREKEGG